VNLGRTCGGFGLTQDGQQRSLANEAARQMFESAATEYEINALPRYNVEAEIAWLRQLSLLRKPLGFRQLIGSDIYYPSAGSKSTVTMREEDEEGYNCAMSNHAMRGGKHSVIFNASDKANDFVVDIGIVRPLPGWDKKKLDSFNPVYVDSDDDVSQDLLMERTERWGTSNVNCCSYNCHYGLCCWSNWSDCHCDGWNGMEGLDEDGTIGMLLDFEEGTLTVYRNGRRLGVVMSGLSGEYCWFTCMHNRGDTVSIERGALP